VIDRRARDPELLDALDALERAAHEGPAWRVVREGRDVLQGSAPGARWDPGTFDVLYTSLMREGALEEIYFHLSRQPVFPSKVRFVLHRIDVRTRRTLRLADFSALARLGVSEATYSELGYTRTQEIGDAAMFLGFDGIVAPSARWDCHNLILFCNQLAPDDLTVADSEFVDWNAWQSLRRELRAT
jgi:hypothetical protein